MAFDAWAQFLDTDNTNLKAKGQAVSRDTKSKKHPADKWFQVVSWDWTASAPVDHTKGQLSGAAKPGTLRIVKHMGDLTAHIINAASSAATFTLQLDVLNQAPEGSDHKDQEPYTWVTLIAKRATFASHKVGTYAKVFGTDTNEEPATGGGSASGPGTQHRRDPFVKDEAVELEVIEIVFQAYELTYAGLQDKDLKGKDTKSSATHDPAKSDA